jgi:putative serine protease PepD
MDRESDGVDDAASRAPGTFRARRALVAAVASAVTALIAVAVLATRLASIGGAPASAAAPPPAPSAAATLTVSAIYQRLAPSVVTIRAGRNLGTGVIVADSGTILTADHVVSGAASITVTFADGTVAAATVVSASRTMDIATLAPQKLPQPVVPATLGGTAGVGAAVVAIGNPLGLTDSVSSGVVSGLDRSARTDTGKRTGLIQFDASVNPGSSGGPLLDDRGMVIGIVVALADVDGQDAFAGIGFAVPIGSAIGRSGGTGQGKGPQI